MVRRLMVLLLYNVALQDKVRAQDREPSATLPSTVMPATLGHHLTTSPNMSSIYLTSNTFQLE